MDIPAGEHVPPIFLLTVVNLRALIILLQELPQLGDLHGLVLPQEAVFRQRSRINKETILLAAVRTAVEHHARDKAGALHIIVKLAGDVGGKLLAPAGVRAVFIHVRPQVAIQGALGLFIGGLIEIPGVGLAQQHDLQHQ